MKSDRERVDGAFTAFDALVDVLSAYASELEAEYRGASDDAESQRTASIVEAQFKQVNGCLESLEGVVYDHLMRVRDRAVLLPKARAGKLL